MHRVGALAQEQRQDCAEISDAVLHRRCAHQQHPDSTTELGRDRESSRTSRSQMMRLVDDHEIRRDVGRPPAATPERFHGEELNGNRGVS